MAYVLVADDDSSVRRVLRHMLENKGHKVWEASGAGQAAHMAVAQHFDLLIMDMVIGRSGGVEAARDVLKVKPSQRIILMSGIVSLDDEALRLTAVDIGVRGLLSKPFTEDSVAEALSRLQVQ